MDTVGEVAEIARKPGFRLPGEPILLRVWLIDLRREFATSIFVDTAGEFAGVARGPGFRLPGELNLPRLRRIDRCQEFASGIIFVGFRPRSSCCTTSQA